MNNTKTKIYCLLWSIIPMIIILILVNHFVAPLTDNYVLTSLSGLATLLIPLIYGDKIKRPIHCLIFPILFGSILVVSKQFKSEEKDNQACFQESIELYNKFQKNYSSFNYPGLVKIPRSELGNKKNLKHYLFNKDKEKFLSVLRSGQLNSESENCSNEHVESQCLNLLQEKWDEKFQSFLFERQYCDSLNLAIQRYLLEPNEEKLDDLTQNFILTENTIFKDSSRITPISRKSFIKYLRAWEINEINSIQIIRREKDNRIGKTVKLVGKIN